MTELSALAGTSVKLSPTLNVILAVDGVVILLGVLFIGWRAWHAFRGLESAAASLHQIMVILGDQERRAQENEKAELKARQNRVDTMAVNIVFDGFEIFEASPDKREIGVGVFTVRNVGNEAVFLLGVTRTAQAGMPSATGRVLSPVGSRDVNLRLDPGDPPLDRDEATIWYRDLLGRHWMRRLRDTRATLVPEEPEPAATQEATAQRPVPQEAMAEGSVK
jgi:hypothetical protein